MQWLLQPWPWWLSGILIGLMVPGLYILAGKKFGISSSFRHLASMCLPNTNINYLKENNWRTSIWNIVLVLGVVIGSWIAVNYLSSEPVEFLPEAFYSTPGLIKLAVGGLLVGFGTRYAGGCTSGHTLSGISNLNAASLVATIFFFIGGLIVTWGLGWLIF